jgi:hypothetical protein
MKFRLKGRRFASTEVVQAELQQILNTLTTSVSASKSGKIAGIVVYKPKVTTSKVMVEIRTESKYLCYYEQILGKFG